jgi:hypothetical protein
MSEMPKPETPKWVFAVQTGDPKPRTLGTFSTRELAERYVEPCNTSDPEENRPELARYADAIVPIPLDEAVTLAVRPLWWVLLDEAGAVVEAGSMPDLCFPAYADSMELAVPGGTPRRWEGHSTVSAARALRMADERRRRDLAASPRPDPA